MGNRSFTNVCLVAIIGLLTLLLLRIGSARAYAADGSQYSVVQVINEDQVPDEIMKQTKAGWELVAVQMWTYDQVHAKGLLIFRK